MPPKTIPKKYTAGLKGKERQAQIKSIKEGKPRPKTSAKSKPSSATVAFNKKYGKQLDAMKGGRSKRNIAKVTGIPFKALDQVYKKGEGAYFSALDVSAYERFEQRQLPTLDIEHSISQARGSRRTRTA